MTASEGAKPAPLKWKKKCIDKELLEVCERETAAQMPDDASDRELEGSGGN